MTTSGTNTFAPEIAELVDEAFERCGVDPATLTGRHLRSARMSVNLLLVEWATKGIHLWAVEQQSTTLTASDATYSTVTNLITILDMVVRRSGVDTPVFPIARDQYLAIPDKTSEGLPTQYWLDRDATQPVITLWNVPENSTDTLIYFYLRRLQDAGSASKTPDIPYQWYEALTSGLAARLAVKYAPDRIGPLRGDAAMQYKLADTEDRERAPTRMKVRFR